METNNFPVSVTNELLENVMRAHSDGWEVYAAIYLQLDRILKASPTVTFRMVPKVPTITLDQVVTLLKKQFIFDHDLITEDRVRLLVTIWSFKNQKVITSEFLNTSVEFPLMLTVLEENDVFSAAEVQD